MPVYVLDTSALQGAPKKVLEMAAEKKLDVAVTPMSIWELLSHLEEEAALDGDFVRAKGKLLRARQFRMLDDPFAAHVLAVGAGSVANPTRFEDREVLGQVLDLLAASPTLEKFYSETVTYPNGERGEVRSCSARAAQILAEHESRYKKHIEKVCKLLFKEVGRPALLNPSALEFVQAAIGGAKNLAVGYQAAGIASDGLQARVFSSTYPHLGYLFERARRYAVQVPKSELAKLTGDDEADAAVVLPLAIDGNDMEDAAILLHLDLTEDRVLVTNDTGTLDALKVAIDRLHEVANLKGAQVVARSRAITPAEFASEVGNTPLPLP